MFGGGSADIGSTAGRAWSGTRRRLLALAGGAGATLLARTSGARGARDAAGPLLSSVHVATNGPPYAGDRTALATIGGPERPSARVGFTLASRASVSLQVLQTGQGAVSERSVPVSEATLSDQQVVLGPGRHTLEWAPPTTITARTYILKLTGASQSGRVQSASTVVRVLGVDAAFAERSARPGDRVTLVVHTDARTLSVQWLHSGPEPEPTYANNQIKGLSMGPPLTVDWSRHTSAPAPVYLQVGNDWPTGIYAVQITADDGRVGYALLVVRPTEPQTRVAVAMPSTTWGAYNFYDANGDGWGDTWYARWKTNLADLTRPNPDRGVPYRYRSYDLAFQHWAARTGKRVDVYADEDLEAFPDAATLRKAYDLIVFPGHTEYVTKRLYDLIEGFRDAGGNLMFLSANNFFRKVERRGHVIDLIGEWRDLDRPEAGLCGVQYCASDRGQHRGAFVVTGADVAPWAFAGTGLVNGSTFGKYGIEIDQVAPQSPPGLQVLCVIPNLMGAARSAMMSYYEHGSGARVFSAGTLDFGGQVLLWPQSTQILANVWSRLAPAA